MFTVFEVRQKTVSHCAPVVFLIYHLLYFSDTKILPFPILPVADEVWIAFTSSNLKGWMMASMRFIRVTGCGHMLATCQCVSTENRFFWKKNLIFLLDLVLT